MSTETTVIKPRRPIIAVIRDVKDLFDRHQISGNALLAAFAHPDITDEQIIAMARSYGACRRGLQESLRLLNESPRVKASFTAATLVGRMVWPRTK